MNIKEFEKSLADILEGYFNNDLEYGIELWNRIFSFLNQYVENLLDAEKLEMTCTFLIELMLKYTCNNLVILMKTLKLYIGWFDLHNRYEVNRIRYRDFYPPLCKFVSQPLTWCEELDETLDSIRHTTLLSVVRSSNYKLSTVLAKYGVFDEEVSEESRFVTARLIHDFRVYVKEKVFPEVTDDISHESSVRVKDRLQGMNGVLLRGFQRILYILHVLRAVQLKMEQDPFLQEYIQCVFVLFRITTEPFISADEVEELVHFLFENVARPTLKIITDIYIELFHPSSTMPYTPRCLKHLCRCKVRKILSNRSAFLPLLADQLDIPNELKSYILGLQE